MSRWAVDQRLAGRGTSRLLELVEGSLDASNRTRRRALVGAIAAIASIGIVDSFTGEKFSIAMFYLVPVSLAALVVSTPQGVLLALLASFVRILDETIVYGNQDYVTIAWNFLGRFISVAIIVYLIGALREVVRRLAESERSSRAFLATAAHQLRTPIAGLVASAEALSYEPDSPTRARLLENLVAGTNRSRRLIASLLELSRLDHGGAPEQRVVDLAAICRRELEVHEVTNRSVSLEYRGPSTSVTVSNEPALREALSNLVDNAMRHAVERVVVTLSRTAELCTIEVRDDGPGVPPGEEEHIFDRFVSADGRGGSGLGLAIARASVRSVGGDVSYERPAFVIRLPAEPVSMERMQEQRHPASA